MSKTIDREKVRAAKKRNRLIVRSVILLVLVSAVVYTLTTNEKGKEAVTVGDIAPDFELLDLEGNKHRLSDYRGEGVFLNFWGTWCPPCKKEMPYMEDLYEEFEEKGVNLLSVNLKESQLKVETFKNQYKLTFPILRDRNESVKLAYSIKPIPSTFLINKDGRIEQIIIRGMSKAEIRSLLESIQPG